MEIFDIHTHILPGIDDGASDRAMAVQMLSLAYEQGVRTLIATPHASMRYHTSADRVRELCSALEQEFRTVSGQEIRIFPGQEIFYRNDVIDSLADGKLMTMADSSYVLMEFMPGEDYSAIYHAARNLSLNGYRMVLAHAERYKTLRTEEHLDELLHLGVYIQMNVCSAAGSWFDRDVRWCRKILKEQKVHFIGSDMHNLSGRRPAYSQTVQWMQKHLDSDYIQEICYGNAVRMIKNERI